MFTAKAFTANNDRAEVSHKNQSSADMASLVLRSPSHLEPSSRPRSSVNQVPRPAPRRQMFETKDSDLDMDIDDLLAIKY